MKIGISYWGQLRNMSITSQTFNDFIKDENNEQHIVYTTWEDENVSEFKKFSQNHLLINSRLQIYFPILL